MEAGGCTEQPEENRVPEAFYIEEAQATLSHIIELGLPELAERCLTTNPGSQVTVPEIPQNKRKTDILGLFYTINTNKCNFGFVPRFIHKINIAKSKGSDVSDNKENYRSDFNFEKEKFGSSVTFAFYFNVFTA